MSVVEVTRQTLQIVHRNSKEKQEPKKKRVENEIKKLNEKFEDISKRIETLEQNVTLLSNKVDMMTTASYSVFQDKFQNYYIALKNKIANSFEEVSH